MKKFAWILFLLVFLVVGVILPLNDINIFQDYKWVGVIGSTLVCLALTYWIVFVEFRVPFPSLKRK